MKTAADAETDFLCEDWAVEPGSVRRVVLRGRPLAVFNVAGELFVTDDTCTHGLASLSEGTLEGYVVTCPWHGGQFDVRTGSPVSGPCTEPLATYRCRVRDEGVWIKATP